MKAMHLVFAAIVCLAASPAHAQLRLSDARREARAQAPEGAALEARVRGAEEILRDARRVMRHDPEISVGYEVGKLSGADNERFLSMGFRLPIDVSGSWTPRRQAAEEERRRAQAEREDGLRALDETVAVAFAHIALGERSVVRAERIAALYDLAAAAEQERMRVGQGNQVDVDLTELDAAGAHATVAESRGALASARAALGRLLGRSLAEGETLDVANEDFASIESVDLLSVVDSDPRVVAAESDARGTAALVVLQKRLALPLPTIGADVQWQRHVIPSSAFQGSALSGFSATWPEWAVVVSASTPIALFDRHREARAQSTAAAGIAESTVSVVRAAVRLELEQAWVGYRAASEARAALAGTSATIERDFGLLDRAVRAGAMDSLARAVVLRRLEDAGRRRDVAELDYEVARARWERRTRTPQ